MATTRTLESAGRAMMQEFGVILGGKSTERPELFEMVVTPDEWNRELV